mmetsp:Transcript_117276/g.175123  ORF Transcript_117276/g.175123 Transcript_117276/m.175123 type:complete len:129 (+) Transcript_117276:270-656(+)
MAQSVITSGWPFASFSSRSGSENLTRSIGLYLNGTEIAILLVWAPALANALDRLLNRTGHQMNPPGTMSARYVLWTLRKRNVWFQISRLHQGNESDDGKQCKCQSLLTANFPARTSPALLVLVASEDF